MKIDKFFEILTKDKDRRAGQIDEELKWMRKKIKEDYEKLWDIRRQLFYKEQQFDAFYKTHANAFNSVCNTCVICESFQKGLFRDNNINTSEAQARLKEIVANFFPQWMWKGLEFFEAVQEGWEARYIDLSFIWTFKNGKKKNEVEFRINIPNPSVIEIGREFDWETSWDKMINLHPDEDCHKTMVSVNTEVKRQKEFRCCTYTHIGSAYMNNEISDIIDKWASEYKKSGQAKG